MISPVKIWRNQKRLIKLVHQTGTIISWTTVRVPPVHFTSQAPYPVAIVKLDNGKNIIVQLVDWEESELKTGHKVITVIRKILDPGTEGVIPYGIKAKPIK